MFVEYVLLDCMWIKIFDDFFKVISLFKERKFVYII